MADDPSKLDKPAGAPTPNPEEPVIHVIPEKFYGAALKKKVPKAVPAAAPVAAAPAAAPAKKGKGGLIIAIVAVVLLLGGGAAAYFLVFAKKPAPPANVNTAPPAPVCGNSKCESPQENSENCSADCGPPPPVCGNGKCEAPKETSANCSADCGPPPPVCGDGKCEGTENFNDCPADCKPPEATPGIDSDSDGLTDEEEKNVFGTNPNDPNTDKDSYVDLNEILNLFDPAKPTPAMLKDNPGITVYSNAAQNYSIFRPSAWTVSDSDPTKVMFSASTGEFIEVLAQDKPASQSIMDWYLAQAPGVTSSQVEPFKTKGGYDAVTSPDRMTTYVDGGDKVYVIGYNLGKRFEIQYKVTYQMMVQSFKKLSP